MSLDTRYRTQPSTAAPPVPQARLTRGAYHAAKISKKISADAMARAKADGANVTAGISINHLSLNDNDVGEYRTFFKLSFISTCPHSSTPNRPLAARSVTTLTGLRHESQQRRDGRPRHRHPAPAVTAAPHAPIRPAGRL